MTAVLRSTLAVLAVTALAIPTAAQAAPLVETGVVTAHDDLRDLAPTTSGPFDKARALAVLVSHGDSTLAILQVRGIDTSKAGRSFGAHLHAGPCVAGDGAAAGPHYNTDTIAGTVPPRVNPSTEIWFDFTVSPSGAGNAMTVVPFTPLPGNRSVVIHEKPTDHHGAAGQRLACLPLAW
ncbi:Cu/Zn superoxide dismutase [Kribbella steppae]|uniref:Cu/Zn superoxide dismutase n=1 Tax=Kribbella steppae TaxID=2512223 RepID=A0A4R2HNF9_9ACTN|nr:superoxide dismutase family protein [Kribbella steppae]TCO32723.1 Cu/Zn superoxide dismutase [Kribbella steppae]